MNIILFENREYRQNLKPLTLTRPIGMLRLGILTIKEKWETRLGATVSFNTEPYLSKKFPVKQEKSNLYVNASFLPTKGLLNQILKLASGQILIAETDVVAYYSDELLTIEQLGEVEEKIIAEEVKTVKYLADLFLNNGNEIREDFEFITKNRDSILPEDPHAVIYNPPNVFIEEGASLRFCVINAENGPVYIGKNVTIQEGAILIGPVAVCDDSLVAYGAKIRQDTTIGPVCKVGGEVGGSIFYGYSNKAHDGYLGNSYIGEWCNLGANTNTSNLKNDYTPVKLYDYQTGELRNSGQLFCGTFMGDYSKAGISTMFNTGTVVGVSCNIFGAGFQSKLVYSFSWGGALEGYQPYRFEKAVDVINVTMARRNLQLNETDLEILKIILEKHA
jgi:UDP-N-acetylglucosamine diphosphorylase/glucosamine-1-phosphate N-acetyltransferase